MNKQEIEKEAERLGSAFYYTANEKQFLKKGIIHGAEWAAPKEAMAFEKWRTDNDYVYNRVRKLYFRDMKNGLSLEQLYQRFVEETSKTEKI